MVRIHSQNVTRISVITLISKTNVYFHCFESPSMLHKMIVVENVIKFPLFADLGLMIK